MTDYKLICTDCGAEFVAGEVDYVCPKCEALQKSNETLRGVLRVEFDYASLKKKFTPRNLKSRHESGIGRFRELLPLLDVSFLPPLCVGPTPLFVPPRLSAKHGFPYLFIKNDSMLPTASLKDRASAFVVAKARELERDVITTASTGNAATALAGMCAASGQKSVIFVPKTAPAAKLAQIATFGAKLVTIDGTYDDACLMSREATNRFGWYNRNTAFNPFTIEGKKTVALEIWEQLSYKAPDVVFVPTGDGAILAGIYKGFYDLLMIGAIESLPRIVCVQAEGSAAIATAFAAKSNEVTPLEKASTCADSISVKSPAAGSWALKILHETGGFCVTVTDNEIIAAIKEFATLSGVFAEPAAAAAYAGFSSASRSGLVSSEETAILMITGSGLKDVPTAMKAVTIPNAVSANLSSLGGLQNI